VVVSDLVGASYDLVQSGINGYTYRGGNVEALRSVLATMVAQREQWTEMGERSWEIVQDWGHERCIQELERAVNYALARRR